MYPLLSFYRENLTNFCRVFPIKIKLSKAFHEKIAAQEQILILNEQAIETQKTLNAVLGLLVFFAIVLTMSLWKNFDKKKKANAILHKYVNKRTYELELSYSALVRAFEENDALIEKASIAIKKLYSLFMGYAC